jgi:hypothetical protein
MQVCQVNMGIIPNIVVVPSEQKKTIGDIIQE